MISSATHYSFPAIRGIQAGRQCITAMCELRYIPKLFPLPEGPPSLAERKQRDITKARGRTISSYIADNPKSYILPPLIASVDELVEFIPCSDKPADFAIGTLKISRSATITLTDGQHRRMGIEQALKKNKELAGESIPIVFFLDWGTKHSRQMFADLNRHAVRPARSLNILFDNRDPYATIVTAVVDQVAVFRDFTDMEKSDTSGSTTKVFALSGLYTATKELLQDKKELTIPEQLQLVVEFWQATSEAIPEWQMLTDGNLSPAALKQNYICSHSVALAAIGRVGRCLLNTHPQDWPERINWMEAMDWARTNILWQGRVVVAGKILNTRKTVVLMAGMIKSQIGMPRDDEETAAELALAGPESVGASGTSH